MFAIEKMCPKQYNIVMIVSDMSEWVAICREEGEAPIEVETEADGMLLLESLTAHYPGTTTLKYWNSEKTAMRGVKCIEGKMAPPTGGWDQASLYICVNPNKVEQTIKRKAESEERDSTVFKAARHQEDQEFDPEATIDLILLGLNPQTTEKAIKDFFEKVRGDGGDSEDNTCVAAWTSKDGTDEKE